MHRKHLDIADAEVVGQLIDHAAKQVLRIVKLFHPFVSLVKRASPCILDGKNYLKWFIGYGGNTYYWIRAQSRVI